MLKLCIGTPITYSSAFCNSAISRSDTASTFFCSTVRASSGVYAAATQSPLMTGIFSVVRSREITVPSGWALIQLFANSAVNFRETDRSPIGLESIFNKVDIAAPYPPFDAYISYAVFCLKKKTQQHTI